MDTTTPKKIRFRQNSSAFYPDLKREVAELLGPGIRRKAAREMWVKFVFYSMLYLCLYATLYIPYVNGHFILLLADYVLLGLTGILLAFNCAHDCVHNTFSGNRKLNRSIFYVVFSLQGVNARLWHKRHIASHHVFPNVDGCDSDIDDNPFLRLSPTHKLRPYQKYQHLYATILYSFYTPHWIFIKDFIYLGKKNLANLKNQSYPFWFKMELVLLKAIYLLLLVGLPVLLTTATLGQVIIAFLVMHVVISLFFVLTLIISHLCMETEFPQVNADGELPYDYYEHQLAVSLDYHPESRIANFIFGGFNSHTAHHLFPNLQHTLYTKITPSIREKAQLFRLPYNKKSIPAAIRSHFMYLKKLGSGL